MAEQKATAAAATTAEAEAKAKLLVERLVGVASDDHERFLLKIKDRFHSVGMELPTVEVRAEDVEMEAEAYARGQAAAPNIFNSMTNTALESANGGRRDVVTNYMMQILGLQLCADTLIGNDMARGISGGQRKRVTIGEMLVSPAKVLLMDEISNGLDSSTTFQIVNSLRQLVQILGRTAVISLLQPAPETYDLFDDIILLSEGHVVYQGPKEDVVEFFESRLQLSSQKSYC